MTHWEEVLSGTDLMLTWVAPEREEPLIQDALRAFTFVWHSVPDLDRESIIEHWVKHRSLHRPGIVLEEPWFGGDENLAATEEAGLAVRFDWATMKHFPAELMRSPIAHELAHVFQWSLGKHRLNLSPDDLRGSIRGVNYDRVSIGGRVELHADEIMLEWGFNPTHGIAWLHQNFRIRNGKAERRSRPLTKKYSRAKASAMRWRRYHF